METADHVQTASWGNRPGAQEYRELQRRLIRQGRAMDAVALDIVDITLKFGDKYDAAISQVMDYLPDLVGKYGIR
jgi:hypothetical protein